MRIVAGLYRGRPIEAPQGEATRPTTDRVREAMMSALSSLRGGFDGAIVLDAFAGSGALGIEALSRGARAAQFFERDRKAYQTLKRNLSKLNIEGTRARALNADVTTSRQLCMDQPFDLVFFDPPYAQSAEDVLGFALRARDAGKIGEDAIIVYEHALSNAADVEKSAQEKGFEVLVSKKYGKTGVTMMQVATDDRGSDDDE